MLKEKNFFFVLCYECISKIRVGHFSFDIFVTEALFSTFVSHKANREFTSSVF